MRPPRCLALVIPLALAAAAGAAEIESPLPRGTEDQAFKRYVDLALVRKAVTDNDPALLCDVALQMAEGERVLLRAHKGLPSSRLFRLALEAAAERRDLKTIDRLEKGVKLHQHDALAKLVPAARLLAGKPRRLDAGTAVAADGMSVEALLLYKSYLEQIRLASTLNDKGRLTRLEKGIPNLTELGQNERANLRIKIKEARKSLEDRTRDDDGDDLLRKLAASSRSAKQVESALKE